MKRVILLVGHSCQKQGARSKSDIYGVTEYEINLSIARQVQENFFFEDEVDLILKTRKTNYKDLPEDLNSLNPGLIIEMHCNAVDKKVQGTEVLYWHTSKKSKKVAEILQSEFLKALELPDRGIKAIESISERGGFLLNKTKCTCVITEPFFIDVIKSLDLRFSVPLLSTAYTKSITEAIKIL
jgi:N-acetylmuramoyl-L-alanine amidase